jgi:hypothetical protein
VDTCSWHRTLLLKTPSMDRAANTRREIAPLRVPWLQHEQFPAIKQACSSDTGLVSSSKHALVKVVQELKVRCMRCAICFA